MNKRKIGFLFLSTSIGLGIALCLFKFESPLFYESFTSDPHWETQCTKSDINGDSIIPAVSVQSNRSAMPSTEDGMLQLNTGAAEHTGGGEWSKAVEIDVGPDTVIEWQWAALDAGDYQFWIRIRFDNNRSIFYQAGDARPPGLYRSGKWVPYNGETFRDRDGRLRMLPAVSILVRPPGGAWTVLRRNISEDYLRCYGDVPLRLAISEITIGMLDDSTRQSNELGIEYLKIDA